MAENGPTLHSPDILRYPDCWDYRESRFTKFFYPSWFIAIIAGLLYIFCSSSPPAPAWKWIVPLIIFYPLLLYNIINSIPLFIKTFPVQARFFLLLDVIVMIWFFLTSSTTRYTTAAIWLSLPVWIPTIVSSITNSPQTLRLAMHIVLYIFYSCFCWRYVVRLPRWRRNPRSTNVCEECKTVLGRSSLIFGTMAILTRVVEWHRFHLNRGSDCVICSILVSLYDEVDDSQQSQVPPPAYGTFFGSPWHRTRPTISSEEGHPLIAAEREEVMFKIMTTSFEPALSPWAKPPTRTFEHVSVVEYSDCYFQVRRANNKMSKRIRVNRVPYNEHIEPTFYNSTRHPRFLQAASKWIDDCSTRHGSCGSLHTDGTFIPNRLIAVGTLYGSPCRLVEKEGLQDVQRLLYFALSHCWGGDVGLKLLKNNYSAMKECIAAGALPPTFRDAMYICRKSDVRYIWIDSLCIIQDSPEDWAHESVLMANVYANAGCTISSTASDNSNGGCFRRFSPPRGECGFLFGENCGLRVQMPETKMPTAALFRTRVLDAPVSKRGWVFQERLLSRRVLHFCSDTIFFECNRGQETNSSDSTVYYGNNVQIVFEGKTYDKEIVSIVETKQMITRSGGQWNPPESARRILETAPTALIERVEDGYYKECSTTRGIRSAFDALKSTNKYSMSNSEGTFKFNRQWYELVSYYSAGDITVHTDRLVAIAGIAAKIERRTQASYLAGLWADIALEFGLLWRAERPREKHPKYCAPSWSWAAVNGPVTLLPAFEQSDFQVEVLAQVSRSIATLDGQRVTSAASLVDGGSIDIAGPAADITFPPERQGLLAVLSDDEESQTFISFYPDYKDYVPEASATSPQSNPPSSSARSCKALLVARTRRNQDSLSLSYGLVLMAKSESSSLDDYERVGVFEVSDSIETDLLVFRNWTEQSFQVV